MSMEVARSHYAALRKYLASHLLKEQNFGISPQRQSARDKLVRLTQQQFQELSTDVYDELTRRLLNSPSVPFLPLKDDYHPKRNQARQKLATLPKNRFKDLASDVYTELDRRYPSFTKEWSSLSQDQPYTADSTNSSGGGYNRSNSMTTPEILPPRKAPPPPTSAVPSLPNSSGFNPGHNSGSNTSISSSSRSRSVDHNSSSNIFMDNSMLELYTEIVPEKSQAVIREENLDYTVHTHHESIPSSKTGTLNNLEMLLKSGNNTPVMNSKKASPDLDQEVTIENLRNKIRDLERRLTVGSNSESLLLNNLQFQLQKSREEYNHLESKYHGLEKELHSVSKDGKNKDTVILLETVQFLTKQTEELQMEKDSMETQLRVLQEKNVKLQRYVDLFLKELRAVKNTSEFAQKHMPSELNDQAILNSSEAGCIDYNNIVEFQLAVDKMLRAARYESGQSTLANMEEIVLKVRKIADQIPNPELAEQLNSSLTSLVSAVRLHSSSYRVAPVALLESCTLSLTERIIQAVQHCHIKTSTFQPSSYIDLEQQYQVDLFGKSFKKEDDDVEIKDSRDYKVYLEDRADEIVQAIQNLMLVVRSFSPDNPELVETLEHVSEVVHHIIRTSKRAMNLPTLQKYKEASFSILEQLERNNEQLITMKKSLPSKKNPHFSNGSVPNKQALASVSFEIAKYTKELLALLD